MPLHVIVLNYLYDAELASPEQALERYFVMTDWSAGLLAANARVTVLWRFSRDATVQHQGATYSFLADAGGKAPPHLRPWQVPRRLHQAARAVCADSHARGEDVLVHVNGLVFPVPTRFLSISLSYLGMTPHRHAVVAQHHAESPWPGPAGCVQRWGLRSVDGFFFAARELAGDWVDEGIIRSADMVYEVMEASTSFRCQPRSVARARTGLWGDPVVLWTGNLNGNKDPLTILAGFERILEHRPNARLYMAYREADLLLTVERRIADSEELRGAVTLLGQIGHAEIEWHYNSADYFVQGSAREGSGLALLEALACGVVPVVTDIPSFRVLTDDGRVGALWPPGDVDGFVRTFLRTADQPIALLRGATAEHFSQHWSVAANGRRAVDAYCAILSARSTGGSTEASS